MAVAAVLLSAPLALVAAQPARATTFVMVEGSVVTVTISLSVPEVTMRDSAGRRMPMSEYVEQAGEAIWNAALADLAYRDCFVLRVDVDANGVPAGGTARSGDHRIGYNPSPTFRSFVNVPLAEGESTRAQEDGVGPYDYSGTGVWGPIDEVTVAHELGHLMGLGDDYRDVGGTYRDVRSIPAPGREGTLMAGGDRIDQELVDRLGSLLDRIYGLPECWTGTLRGSWTTSTAGCSGSAFEGKVVLTVVNNDILEGTLNLVESVDCLGFEPKYEGSAVLGGTFDGQTFHITAETFSGGVNVWGCGLPAIQVSTPGAAAGDWTASIPPDSAYDCHLTLERQTLSS